MAGVVTPLTLSGDGIIAAGGRGEVTLGQVPVGKRWEVWSLTVNCDSLTSFSRAFVYKGVADSQANLLDQTQQYGGNANTTDTLLLLQPGETLRVVWTEAEVGVTCGATAQVRQIQDA